MKFKVGDKVKVGKFVPQYEGDSYGNLIWPEGVTGEVVNAAASEDAPYEVHFSEIERGQFPSCYAESELEAAV